MTSQRCLFLSDGKYQYPVHVQSFNRSPPGCCQAHEVDTFPPEMLTPGIASWIIKSYFFAALRVNRCLACCLAE